MKENEKSVPEFEKRIDGRVSGRIRSGRGNKNLKLGGRRKERKRKTGNTFSKKFQFIRVNM